MYQENFQNEFGILYRIIDIKLAASLKTSNQSTNLRYSLQCLMKKHSFASLSIAFK